MVRPVLADQLPRPPLLPATRLWGMGAIAAIGLSLYAAGLFQQAIANPNGMPLLWRFVSACVQPDVSSEFLGVVARATLVTLVYAVCGTVLSVILGSVGAVLASEIWWIAQFPHHLLGRSLRYGIRLLLAVPRAIHEMIWGLFFVNIFGLDPLVAILAIAIPYGAIITKVFSEILDETPRQPLFSLLNSGVAPFTAFIYSLIPQAFLDLLSYTLYRFECSIRSAAVLGIIGAGGLGYEILLSLQSLRYEQLWTLFYALFLLNGLVDLGSALLRRYLDAPSRIELNLRKPYSHLTPAPHRHSPFRDRLLQSIGFAMSLLILGSFWYIGADFSKLWSERTIALLVDITQAALPPDLDRLHQLLPLSLQTLAMSILAIAMAGIGGFLLSFPAAANLFLPGGLLRPGKPGHVDQILAWSGFLLIRTLLLFCRAIPAPIWALVALFVLFPGILPGAIALGIHNLGILGRLMAEVTENLDHRPLMSLKAQGTPAPLVFLYGVLPLTFTRFLSYTLYRWEVCTRETVIVGLVGAGGLGRLLTEQLTSFDYQHVIVTLLCFLTLTLVVDWISHAARRSLR